MQTKRGMWVMVCTAVLVGPNVLQASPSRTALLFAHCAFGAVDGDVDEILRCAKVKGGLCVQIGCGDGRLAAQLARDGRWLVHAVDADNAHVDKARSHLRSFGLYGRASIERNSLKRLPYASNIVNLVVIDDLPKVLEDGLSLDELRRILCPSGVVCVRVPGRCPRRI